MEEMEISYQLEEEEIRDSLWEVWKKTKLAKTLLFAVVFFLFSLDFFWAGTYFVGSVSLIAGGAVICVPLYQLRRAAAYSGRAHLRYHILLLEDECTIDVRSPESEENHPYTIGYGDVHKIYNTRDFFLVCITRDKIIPVPKSALSIQEREKVSAWFSAVFLDKYKTKKLQKQ